MAINKASISEALRNLRAKPKAGDNKPTIGLRALVKKLRILKAFRSEGRKLRLGGRSG